MMEQLIIDFPNHLRDAIRIGREISWTAPEGPITNVLVTGLGGSGIGGALMSRLVSGECKVPVLVNNNYTLPGWVGTETLVIACSYSGNTEETLSAFEEAVQRGAKIACITSGGSLLELAGEHKLPVITIPGDNPPRSMLGYALPQLLFVMHKFGLIGNDFVDQFVAAADRLENEQEALRNRGVEIASQLKGRMPVLYSETLYEPVAIRFRQQLNENGKVLCWHHALPEMNHNELVGWASASDNISVVMFRSEDDHERTAVRMNISKEIFGQQTPHLTEVHAKGNSLVERFMYLIHIGDWASYELACQRGIDSVEVDVITHLKSELANI